MDNYDFQDIQLTYRDQIAILTLHRPNVLNAIRQQTKAELAVALKGIASDREVRGLIITGSGRAFSSGNDISEIGISRPPCETEQMSRDMHSLLDTLASLHIPTMAAINGLAFGGGFELALACDLRICCDKTMLGLPEIALGILPCYGGTQRLAHLLDPCLAKELLFSGRSISADEARTLGLVNRITECDTLLEDAVAWMQDITSHSAAALYWAKRCVDDGAAMSFREGLALESRAAGVLIDTPEARELVGAFLKGRNSGKNKAKEGRISG